MRASHEPIAVRRASGRLLRLFLPALLAWALTLTAGSISVPRQAAALQEWVGRDEPDPSFAQDERERWQMLALSTAIAVFVASVLLESSRGRHGCITAFVVAIAVVALLVGSIGGLWPEIQLSQRYPGWWIGPPAWVKYWAIGLGGFALVVVHLALRVRSRRVALGPSPSAAA